ncbi:MAG: hypothetical protein HYV53_00945 [Parcubacteria group bacterium]|nr:hypothetical protein [Parcubacteria group bacterium]
MQEQDLRQIGDLLDKKLDEKLDLKFKENNRMLKEEIIDEMAIVVNQAFSEQKIQLDKNFADIDKNFAEVKEEIAKRPTTERMFSWADERITTLELEADKVKYLHREEWKKLPSALEINQTLLNDGLK